MMCQATWQPAGRHFDAYPQNSVRIDSQCVDQQGERIMFVAYQQTAVLCVL